MTWVYVSGQLLAEGVFITTQLLHLQEDCGLLSPSILSPCSGPYLLPIDLPQPNPGMDVGRPSLKKNNRS
jgi:hypothetical protein